VGHVPAILCSRRMGGDEPDDGGSSASIQVLRAHLERSGLSATVEGTVDRSRVRWALPRVPLVSIVVPTRDKGDVLRRCVESIEARTAYHALELVVVDNGSEDPGTLAYLAVLEARGTRVLRWPHPFNWSAINNLAARAARGELLLFLNNDIEVLDADWLGELVGWALRPGIGVVGGLLLRPDRTIQHAGVVVGLGGMAAHPFEGLTENADGVAGRPGWYRNWIAVTGACQMVRRSVFEDLGGFDEGFLALFSDVDFCVRAWRHGYRNVYTPFARMLHSHGTTRGGDARMPPHDFVVAFERLGDVLRCGDPYWNPLLSLGPSVPCLRPAGELDRARWLGHLVEVLQERFPGEAARSPQVLAECGAEANRRISLGAHFADEPDR
jgi:O-antigen biosynthesis protein